LEYIWDKTKERINLAKHGFDFATAVFVFDDPNCITEQDREVDGEERWQTIGMIDGLRVLLVAHTFCEDHELVEIISARKASRHERRKYEKST
jgi:uncharacterized DUF497 family protein